jgi:hypothetical protein
MSKSKSIDLNALEQELAKRAAKLLDRAASEQFFHAVSDDALLDRRATAAGLGMSVKWVENKAWLGGGPPFVKVGGKCLYRKKDVLQWLSQHGREMRSTSDTIKR